GLPGGIPAGGFPDHRPGRAGPAAPAGRQGHLRSDCRDGARLHRQHRCPGGLHQLRPRLPFLDGGCDAGAARPGHPLPPHRQLLCRGNHDGHRQSGRRRTAGHPRVQRVLGHAQAASDDLAARAARIQERVLAQADLHLPRARPSAAQPHRTQGPRDAAARGSDRCIGADRPGDTMIQVPAEQERDAHRAAAAAALPTAGPVVPVYYNRRLPEAQRRQAIYDGALFVFSGLAAIRRLGDWAGELAAKAFQGVPEMLRAHRHLAVEEFVRRVSPLKSRFTNDARTKRLCQELVVEMGADPQRTYFDLPRLRVIPPASYLAAGVSYNYAPHRDTWYAHPRQLVNYWAPLHDTQASTVMTMFVDHFRRPVANTSARWDYGEWVRNA